KASATTDADAHHDATCGPFPLPATTGNADVGVNPFPALRVINPLGIDARLCSNDVGPFPQRPTHSIVPDLLGQQLELPDDVVQPFDLTVSHLPSSGVPRTNR